jgi:hypothetical protein
LKCEELEPNPRIYAKKIKIKILGSKPKVLSFVDPGSKVLLKCKNWKTLVVT